MNQDNKEEKDHEVEEELNTNLTSMRHDLRLPFYNYQFYHKKVKGKQHSGDLFIKHIENQNHKSYRTSNLTIIDRRLFYQKMKSYMIETLHR